ncbi:MAG: DUF3990 domain-containing protein [Victivallales bacterium]|nr:DUF3990 domain-containing protein [Victivallales bacterium]
MIVYHGSTSEVRHPDISFSKNNLDFGRGFYMTSYREQAERWAKRKAMRCQSKAFLSIYELADDLSAYRVLRFTKIDETWLDFICSCRRGGKDYQSYDIIQGPIADDDVFQCVSFYYRGIWTREHTLEELRFCRPNDQIAVISSTVIDKSLTFVKSVVLEETP